MVIWIILLPHLPLKSRKSQSHVGSKVAEASRLCIQTASGETPLPFSFLPANV